MRICLIFALLFFSCSSKETSKVSKGEEVGRPVVVYEKIHEPKSDDWLALHDESIQSFSEFEKQNHQKIDKLCLVRIGPLSRPNEIISESIAEYLSIFYNLSSVETDTLNQLPDSLFVDNRLKSTSLIQTFLSDPDAIMLGISEHEMRPYESAFPIFGQASFEKKIGVISLNQPSKMKNGRPNLKLLEMRMLKIASHEAGHLFGLKHCKVYQCNMNGVNQLRELDSKPAFLCPNCLQKLEWVRKHESSERSKKLNLFWMGRNTKLSEHYRLLSGNTM